MSRRVGLLGLGIMGSAYAGNLIRMGFPASGYDVDPAALRAFEEAGGTRAPDARTLARESDVLLSALPSVAAAEAAFFGPDGVAGGAHGKLIVVEMSTLPIAVFASGERAAFDRVEHALRALARVVRYVGPFGAGSKLKFIANLLVTIHNLSTAEAVVLAQKAGIDPSAMIEIVGEGAGASRMLAVRGPMMVAGAYEPASMKLDVYQKDIDIIADFAREVGAPTPLFTESAGFYAAAIAQGRGKQDTAAIASVLKTMAGLAADP
jgi:3-hydroxyisobutyrate dehydrogenase-like beta-hydroxyacid dehydrogenase